MSAAASLAAVRSASEEHLDHLAAATAHAILNPDDLERHHFIVLLRLVGDLTATTSKCWECLWTATERSVDDRSSARAALPNPIRIAPDHEFPPIAGKMLANDPRITSAP